MFLRTLRATAQPPGFGRKYCHRSTFSSCAVEQLTSHFPQKEFSLTMQYGYPHREAFVNSNSIYVPDSLIVQDVLIAGYLNDDPNVSNAKLLSLSQNGVQYRSLTGFYGPAILTFDNDIVGFVVWPEVPMVVLLLLRKTMQQWYWFIRYSLSKLQSTFCYRKQRHLWKAESSSPS